MKKKLGILLSVLALSITLTGCKAYDKPEVILISPSETAFLIPLVGDTSKQGAFNSEALLAKTKISTKEIEIPHRWLKTGRMNSNGEWRATATLIKVERKPVTREWTESSAGTSVKNEGIVAESKESIGFMSRMNCSAQIDEADAVKFLYRYAIFILLIFIYSNTQSLFSIVQKYIYHQQQILLVLIVSCLIYPLLFSS